MRLTVHTSSGSYRCLIARPLSPDEAKELRSRLERDLEYTTPAATPGIVLAALETMRRRAERVP